MKPIRSAPFLLSLALLAAPLFAREMTSLPASPELAGFSLYAAPAAPSQTLLRKGDRLAIIGDSITEQKMYSRIIEAYLTTALPELEITCRQFGWSGERAPGFYGRMKNDCLRFKPTIATTCYGMNDHEYRPFEERIGKTYRESQTAIVKGFKDANCRVVLGCSGPVGKMPSWVKSASGTVRDLNLNLAKLRDVDIEIAEAEHVGFADVFWPMLKAGIEAREKFGPDFCMSGKDGVHPGWAGHTFMAYAYLRGLGVSGEIGTFTVDLGSSRAVSSEGHKVLGFKDGTLKLRSSRYPFCPDLGDATKDDSIGSALTLLPFNQELNRLLLVVKNAPANGADVTWGTATKTYTKAELEKGVNLAADFPNNPFRPAFQAVWDAVGAKQNYETRQIKELFHGPEGKADADATASLTEKVRAPLEENIRKAMKPVDHELKITAK